MSEHFFERLKTGNPEQQNYAKLAEQFVKLFPEFHIEKHWYKYNEIAFYINSSRLMFTLPIETVEKFIKLKTGITTAKLVSIKCKLCSTPHHDHYECSNCGYKYGYLVPYSIKHCSNCGCILYIQNEE